MTGNRSCRGSRDRRVTDLIESQERLRVARFLRHALMVIAMLATMGGVARLNAADAADPIASAERALGFARGQVFDLDSNDTVADAWVVGTRSECSGLGHCSSSCVEVSVAHTNYDGSFAFDTLRGIENFEQHLYLDGYVQGFRQPATKQTDAGLKKPGPNETYGEPDPITGRIAFLSHDAVLMYCESAPFEVLAIQRLHCPRSIGVRHFHKAETAWATRVPIGNQGDLIDVSVRGEQSANALFSCRERKIPYI